MATKRRASRVSGASKKARDDGVGTVVTALSEAEALPGDIQKLFATALPAVLRTCKVDRHPYQTEFVDAAEKALGEINSKLEESHKAAAEKQSEITGPAETARREAAKTELESMLKDATAKWEAKTREKQGMSAAVHTANGVVKETTKAATKATAEFQKATDQKTELLAAVATDLETLKAENSSTSAGKKALKTMVGLGKTHGFDQTLLQSFPLACKRDAASRTEFDVKMFTMMADALNKQVEICTQNIVGLEAEQAEKSIAIQEAKKALESAEEELNEVEAQVKQAKTGMKDVEKELLKATASRAAIWTDMKEACLATETIAAELKEFNETLMPLFLKLKEKEPEPEPVEEPVVEPVVEEPATEKPPEVTAVEGTAVEEPPVADTRMEAAASLD